MLGPLDGLTAFDTTQDAQGALTSMLLADHGARVVKLEAPGGRDEPAWLAVARKAWDRGKWSIHLDPSTGEGAARLEAAGVPCERVVEEPYMPEFLWDEWGPESGRIFEQHHGQHGWIREVGLTIHLSRHPGTNKGPGPLLGEHSREVPPMAMDSTKPLPSTD